MSYNISSIDIIGGEGLFITKSDLAAFSADTAHTPESWEPPYGLEQTDNPRMLRFASIPWHGEGTRRLKDRLLALLGDTYGSADLLLCWEGGDSYTGLRVVNGVVTSHKVVMMLGEQK